MQNKDGKNHPLHYASLLRIEFMHVLQSPTGDFFFLTQQFAKSQLQIAVSFLFLFRHH